MKFNQVTRIRWISGMFIFLAIAIIARLYDIQILKHDVYAAEAERQYLVSDSGVYDRGNIYFETKDRELLSAATLKSGYTVAVNLRNLESQFNALSQIAPLVGVSTEELERRISSSSARYIELVRRLSETSADAINKLDIPGIEIVAEKWRFYPANNLASHVIGFAGYSGSSVVGRYGLERYYDDLLSRNFAKPVYKNFFADLFSGIKNVTNGDGIGADIVATIEPNVEIQFEQELKALHDARHSEGTGGIIMDPRTGEIIAMAYLPNFDPNNYGKESDQSVFVNPLVERVYEMGSILKPLTMAVGIDTGAVNSDTMYDDPGFLIFDGLRISNFDGKGRGRVSMQEVLNQSLNTGAVYVQRKVGKQTFVDYFKRFGFGQETGIDLPGEIHGLIDNLDSPRDIELATASFGQGIALTPIAMVRALSVLANGGYLVSPHAVKAFKYDIGLKKNVRWEEKIPVLSPGTAEEITRMLVKVYDDALVGGTVKMDRYSIAAKTGTAQIANTTGRGYYEDQYLHSFFGYFPAYDAKFLIFLYTINPKGVRYSSETLTVPFVNTVKFLINYYNVAPDR